MTIAALLIALFAISGVAVDRTVSRGESALHGPYRAVYVRQYLNKCTRMRLQHATEIVNLPHMRMRDVDPYQCSMQTTLVVKAAGKCSRH